MEIIIKIVLMAGSLQHATSEVVLKSLFKKYDTDNTNSISAPELRSLCYDMGLEMSKRTQKMRQPQLL
eukprot:g31422.t1